MKIGIMRRLLFTYRFWQALGEKKHNCVMSLIHEDGFSDLISTNISDDEVDEFREIRYGLEVAREHRRYDHER